MHAPDLSPTPLPNSNGLPWYKELNSYHWFVLLVSVLGWLFDTMDQQLFNLARGPALAELLKDGSVNAQWYGGLATCIFMIGWATGGIVFGIMGDRWGRAKTMMLTILLYSLFTGLSAASVWYWDFVFYRFLTGLGVGGEFAVGVALVAEVMPDRARAHALGWLQAFSAVGNITAAFISIGLAPLETAGLLGEWQPWRYMFLIGALPALLALLVRWRLKEPEKWSALRASGTVRLGSFADLFGDPRWRRNAIVGLILATSGVVGLWGIGFFGFDLVRAVFRETFVTELRAAGRLDVDGPFVASALSQPELLAKAVKELRNENALIEPQAKLLYRTAMLAHREGASGSQAAVLGRLEQQGKSASEREQLESYLKTAAAKSVSIDDETIATIKNRGKELEGRLTRWSGIYGLLFNIGAFFGIYSFSRITHNIGRKLAFAIAFTAALITTAYTFWNLKQFNDVYWMVPMMGYFQIALFGGYAIYFPELFPTRLRSTGISFCYNVGRYVASLGPLLLGALASWVFGQFQETERWRYAGVTMCSFFLLGLAALPFAPETRGKPLPE